MWKRTGSENAVVCMSVARVKCAGLSIGQAVRETLSSGDYCNVDLISDDLLQQIEVEVSEKLQAIERERNNRPRIVKRLPETKPPREQKRCGVMLGT